MRKLKLQMQITLDGFVAGPNGENDWVFTSGPDEAGVRKVAELADTADTLLIGRKSAQSGFIDYWKNVAENEPDSPWNAFAKLMVNHRKIVFSRTGASFSGNNVEVENGDLATAIQALKNEPGKDILVYGGVDFARSLVDLNLVDEYLFFICPVAIGSGLSIFKDRKLLKLEDSIPYKSGKLLNRYTPA
ncbi:MAG TPA: dihydrofolate reductase family protein [Mucilaginibacter sp.]|jgi:dihydrofolate reductase